MALGETGCAERVQYSAAERRSSSWIGRNAVPQNEKGKKGRHHATRQATGRSNSNLDNPEEDVADPHLDPQARSQRAVSSGRLWEAQWRSRHGSLGRCAEPTLRCTSTSPYPAWSKTGRSATV